MMMSGFSSVFMFGEYHVGFSVGEGVTEGRHRKWRQSIEAAMLSDGSGENLAKVKSYLAIDPTTHQQPMSEMRRIRDKIWLSDVWAT